jgi:hypothetical protein
MSADTHPTESGFAPGTSPRCFLHIPKSAGSSVHSALEAALPPGSLAPQRIDLSTFCDFEDFDLLRPEARRRITTNAREVHALGQYPAVSGHFCLPTLLQVAKASSISTVLREPRARLLSLYMYWRMPGIYDFMAPYSAHEHAQRPLWEFLSEPLLAPIIDNQICRMLLYGDSRLPKSDFAEPSSMEAIAADASEQLDTLGFVGVVELGDSLWQGLTRLFGVELEPNKLNATEEIGSPTPTAADDVLLTTKVLDLIEQHNVADLLVYEHALARAGLDARERQRVRDSAFAHQLVKLGDLVGHSASRAAEQARVVEVLHSQLEDQERSHLELDHERLSAQKRTIDDLQEKLRRRDEDLDKLRHWLNAVHASASWRLTTPLRAAKRGIRMLSGYREVELPADDRSLLARWSVSQVWAFAFILSSIIAATDAILTNRIILIALLATGPICGLLTGRWTRTAATGIWAVILAVLLGFPDEIWDTRTLLVNVGIVAVVAILSTSAASLIERRQAPLA